ncbi:MAG: ABC transporter permease subunit [Acidobacteriota bacterium]
MRRDVVTTLLGNELRMLVRDRRTIVLSVLLPLVVMPLMLFGSRWSEQRRERRLAETEMSYAVTGPHADAVRRVLAFGEARLASEGAAGRARMKLREVPPGDAAAMLEKGEIVFYLEATEAAFGEGATGPDAETRRPGERAERPVPGVPEVAIVFRGDRDESDEAFARARALLRAGRAEARSLLLVERGFPARGPDVAAVVTRDTATAGHVAGLTLGRTLTLLLLFFVLSGGSVVAIDALAGEKERGTLETLLVSAATRGEIVAAKHLAILAVALVVTVIQVGNFLLYIGFKLIPVSAGWAAAVSPPVAGLLLLLYLPVAALVSSVLLLVSGRARSYKEAQLAFFPVFLLGILPALAPLMPGVSLRSAVVAVPIANVAVAVKEVLTGTFDWPMIALAWAVTALAAAGVARLAERALSAERLVSAAERVESLGGPELFERRVARNFAMMWVALVIGGVWLGEDSDIRLQLLVNLGGIFLLGSLLMVRAYRLDPRQVFALRPVRPVVWLAVLAGAPAGMLSAVGVFRLANLVLPVPEKMMKAFGEALLPEGLPLWQVLVLLSIAPGIFEELAFRGTLLHGLRRRFSPPVLALVVGVVFGVFHVALFRIVPTAFLGIALAAVTLLTGSIFPAMVWHALNNLLGLLAGHYRWPLDELDLDFYAAAALVLAASFWVLWRTRRPYPGLRGTADRGQGTVDSSP